MEKEKEKKLLCLVKFKRVERKSTVFIPGQSSQLNFIFLVCPDSSTWTTKEGT